jgi:Na+-driven multidrug efflux pump
MIQIPLAYYLALSADYKSTGVYLAIIIAESFLAVLCVYVFRKGRWKLVKI